MSLRREVRECRPSVLHSLGGWISPRQLKRGFGTVPLHSVLLLLLLLLLSPTPRAARGPCQHFGVEEPPSPEENEPLRTFKDGPTPRDGTVHATGCETRSGIWDAAAADVHRASKEPAGRHQQVHSSSSLEAPFMPRLMPKLLILVPSPNLLCSQKTLPRVSTTLSTRFIFGNSFTTWTTPSAAAPAQSSSGGDSGSSWSQLQLGSTLRACQRHLGQLQT